MKSKLKTSLVSIIVVLSLIITLVPYSSIEAGADEYIEIYTVEDLFCVRNDLTANYRLMNDIDLTEATAKGGEYDYCGNGWDPIGSGGKYSVNNYSGIFDGNGHTISGMRIEIGNIPAGTGDILSAGLFTGVSGTIKNLRMKDTNISISYDRSVRTGAISSDFTGEMYNCAIDGGKVEARCYYTNNYIRDYFVGGLVGYTSGVMSNCYNTAVITTSGSWNRVCAGGIAGSAIDYNSSPQIENCYNTGAIVSSGSGSYAHIHGIIGGDKSSTVTNCYNTGKITKEKDGSTSAISKGTVNNCYYLKDSGNSVNGAVSLSSAQMKIESMFNGFDFDNTWELNADAIYPYPQLKSNIYDDRVVESSSIFSYPEKTSYYFGEDFESDGMVLKFDFSNAETEYINVSNEMVKGYDAKTIGTQELTIEHYRKTFTFDVVVQYKPFVEIRTVADLYNIRNDLTANYRLMNDIDLTEATAKGGEYDYCGNGWDPIGSGGKYSENYYSGIFDGNGHTISGMRIEIVNIPDGTETINAGLFTGVTGTIKNLSLRDIYIDIGGSKSIVVGAITSNLKGELFNCSVKNGTIKSNAYYVTEHCVGGLVGRIYTGLISNCYNTSAITITGSWGKAFAGGIAGSSDYWSSNPQIEECYNTGNIIVSGGNSTSSGSYIHGIIGGYYASTVTNCYNIGTITKERGGSTNAISNGTVNNCYYLKDSGNSVNGAVSLSSAQLIQEEMVSGFDFKDTWIVDEYAKYPYPQLRSCPQNLSQNIEEVNLVSLPNKDYCYLDGNYDCTGGQLEVIYSSGMVGVVDFTNDMLNFDNSTLGTTTVKLVLDDYELSFDIRIIEAPTTTSLKLVSNPNQTIFIKNRTLDFSGAVIQANYSDGTSEVVDVTNAMVSGVDISKSGKYTAVIKFGGQETTFDVEVVPYKVSGLKIVSYPNKMQYVEGEEFDTSGLEVELSFNDGSTRKINNSLCTVSGYTGNPGNNTVEVSYSGFTTSFEVTVSEKKISTIFVKSLPLSTTIIEGHDIDTMGLQIYARYDNGDTAPISDYKISNFDNSIIGMQTVTVTHKNFKDVFVVKVIRNQIESFKISSLPLKTMYNEGERLDTEGLSVEAKYRDGSITHPDNYEVTGYTSTPGKKIVYVSYDGFVDKFEVEVTEKQLSGIEIVAPSKTTYYVGDAIDTSGLEVYALYDNGDRLKLDDTDYTISGFDSRSTGTKIVNVTYNYYSRKFAVTVLDRPVGETELYVSNVKERPNDEFVIDISIKNNPGISGLCHTIKYNSEKFEYVSAKLSNEFKGDFFVNDNDKTKGELTILWGTYKDYMNDSVIYSVVLKVKDDCEASLEEVTLISVENSMCNANGELIVADIHNGSIEVLDYWLGDLDGDRDYSVADIITLEQYVAKKPIELTERQKKSADVNEDGYIDIRDVVMLSQWIVKREF